MIEVDLTFARSTAVALFDHECMITVDAGGIQDLNPVTLRRQDPDPVVYTGPCFLGDRNAGQQRDQGGGDFNEAEGMLRLPWDEDAVIPVGAVVEVTAGVMVGSRWTVKAELVQNRRVTRRFDVARLAQDIVRA